MANWQWFGRLHTRAYRATRGILGGKLAGLPMLLLTSPGRKSGELRTTPLPYLEDDGRWVVVCSNNGGPRDAMWWANLQKDPRAEIQVMRERIPVTARLASPEERTRLRPCLVAFNSAFAKYEKMTTRQIPVVILSRAG